MKKHNRFPRVWDEGRVRRLLDHDDVQTDSEAVAEDEASFRTTTHTAMKVPIELVEVRRLLAKHRPANKRIPSRRADELRAADPLCVSERAHRVARHELS